VDCSITSCSLTIDSHHTISALFEDTCFLQCNKTSCLLFGCLQIDVVSACESVCVCVLCWEYFVVYLIICFFHFANNYFTCSTFLSRFSLTVSINIIQLIHICTIIIPPVIWYKYTHCPVFREKNKQIKLKHQNTRMSVFTVFTFYFNISLALLKVCSQEMRITWWPWRQIWLM